MNKLVLLQWMPELGDWSHANIGLSVQFCKHMKNCKDNWHKDKSRSPHPILPLFMWKPPMYEMSARSVSMESSPQSRILLYSTLCFAGVHGWLVASADSFQQIPMCGKAWQQRVRPCQSKHAERQVDKPHSGFVGFDLTRAEWMSVS